MDKEWGEGCRRPEAVCSEPQGEQQLGLVRAPGVGSGQMGQPSPCQSCELGTSLWDSLPGRMGQRNRAGTAGNRYHLGNPSPALLPWLIRTAKK